MRTCRQRGHHDCGIATAAMLTQTSYRNTLKEFKLSVRSGPLDDGIDAFEIKQLLGALGDYTWGAYIIQKPHPTLIEWDGVPGPAAVLLWQGEGYVGHWVAWMNGVVFDPNHHAEPQLPGNTLRSSHYVLRVVHLR